MGRRTSIRLGCVGARGGWTVVTMGFWDIIAAHMDEYGVTESVIAKKAGMNPKTLNAWRSRGIPKLPKRVDIGALAVVTRRSYTAMLDAILHDTGYLDENEAVVRYGPRENDAPRAADVG